jgi:hypothetical protein
MRDTIVYDVFYSPAVNIVFSQPVLHRVWGGRNEVITPVNRVSTILISGSHVFWITTYTAALSALARRGARMLFPYEPQLHHPCIAMNRVDA